MLWCMCVHTSCACMCACTYGGGVLLLFVQSGAAPLLAVAMLLQRVKHLIGQLQVHPQPIAHVDLWSKLETGQGGYHGNSASGKPLAASV